MIPTKKNKCGGSSASKGGTGSSESRGTPHNDEQAKEGLT